MCEDAGCSNGRKRSGSEGVRAIEPFDAVILCPTGDVKQAINGISDCSLRVHDGHIAN